MHTIDTCTQYIYMYVCNQKFLRQVVRIGLFAYTYNSYDHVFDIKRDMFVRVYIYICIHLYIYTYIYIYTHVSLYTYIHIYICIYTRLVSPVFNHVFVPVCALFFWHVDIPAFESRPTCIPRHMSRFQRMGLFYMSLSIYTYLLLTCWYTCLQKQARFFPAVWHTFRCRKINLSYTFLCTYTFLLHIYIPSFDMKTYLLAEAGKILLWNGTCLNIKEYVSFPRLCCI